ncbi:MAG: hypothetical protein ALAOOOJD_04704 [bacterium]|nr:hypothetical protein [bacterium]
MHFLHRGRAVAHELLAGRRAAGQGDAINLGMLHQRRAGGRAVAGNNIQHSRRQSGFHADFREHQRSQWRLRRRFQN